jgi:hypothetical protein
MWTVVTFKQTLPLTGFPYEYLDDTATVIFPAEFLRIYDVDEKMFTSNLGNTYSLTSKQAT